MVNLSEDSPLIAPVDSGCQLSVPDVPQRTSRGWSACSQPPVPAAERVKECEAAGRRAATCSAAHKRRQFDTSWSATQSSVPLEVRFPTLGFSHIFTYRWPINLFSPQNGNSTFDTVLEMEI